jgi:hypothetical protein
LFPTQGIVLAGHRATNSVYATLGVAAATLVVVGGILAGPSILECSRDADGFGACLRDKVAESGLIAPDDDGVDKPEVVADISSEPSAPPPPTGWMEAAANEFEPPTSVPVDLAGTPADIAVAELVTEPVAPIEVAVAPAAELATAALAPSEEAAIVELTGPELGVVAEATSSSEPSEATRIALVNPDGQITAVIPILDAPIEGTAVLAPPSGLNVEGASAEPVVEATVTPEPIEPPGTLTVVDPAPSEPAPVELTAEASVEPVPAPTSAIIEFNPQYPNVLVLPPPAEGDNSSFRSLQLN